MLWLYKAFKQSLSSVCRNGLRCQLGKRWVAGLIPGGDKNFRIEFSLSPRSSQLGEVNINKIGHDIHSDTSRYVFKNRYDIKKYGGCWYYYKSALTSYLAIFQLYSDGTAAQFPNLDLLPGTHSMDS